MLDKLSPSEGAEVGSMAERILSFYEPLADHYHLIFDDWNSAIERQAKILNGLLAAQIRGHPLKILDCACGIGTQARQMEPDASDKVALSVTFNIGVSPLASIVGTFAWFEKWGRKDCRTGNASHVWRGWIG
jgi:hypothetical protein